MKNPSTMKSNTPALYVLVLTALLLCGPNHAVQEPLAVAGGVQIREAMIPMDDGTLLAADLYMPAGTGEEGPYPVVLEYLPYRKDEGRTHRFPLFSYFVRRGYVVARVDIRGTGRSQGTLVDGEYSEQEQRDGEQVIDWLARQPFSTGKVAMLGISWGGFNGLHMAMRRPPALKTVISLMSTDDIYQDDVHFIDGMMHIDAYEIGQDLTNALPGAPDFTIDEAYFRERFDTPPWLLKYKRQPLDGPFWDRASLNTDYSRIDIPLFVIGGWYDGYRDFIPRILQHADVPVKALLGPWNHIWPNRAAPGPAIEWREMAVRWLDHWLKGEDTGMLEEPSLYVYQRHGHPPGTDLDHIPGHWIASEGWPAAKDSLWYPGKEHQLAPAPEAIEMALEYKPTLGVEASGSVMWWGDWAPDQSAVDAHSLVYDSPPLADSLAILGMPVVQLQAAVNAPAAHWLVRLSDVAPDGKVTQVTGAGLNARHHKGADRPGDVVRDSVYTFAIEMHAASWTFRPGHRIRLAVNNAQWPMIWPTPYPMTARISSSAAAPSFLKLPLLPPAAQKMGTPFPLPVADPVLPGYSALSAETGSGFAEVNEVLRDEESQTSRVVATNSGGDRYPWGTVRYEEHIAHSLSDPRPAEARVASRYSIVVNTGDRTLRWTGLLEFYSDEYHYYYDYTRILENGEGEELRRKNWTERIPRR